MNIDSLSMIPMLSPTEGVDALQQGLLGDSAVSVEVPEFSDALMEKINQLQGLSTMPDIEVEELAMASFGDDNTLHEIADLINDSGVVTDFPGFFGKGLPQEGHLDKDAALENTIEALKNLDDTETDLSGVFDSDLPQGNELDKTIELAPFIETTESVSNTIDENLIQGHQLEKEINLESTLETLTNVLNTLEDGEQGVANLAVQLETPLISVKALAIELPEQGELNDKLEQVAGQLEVLKQQVTASELDSTMADVDVPVTEQQIQALDKIIDEVQQVKELVSEQQDISVESELENQIVQLAVEIEGIKDNVSKKISMQLAQQQHNIDATLDGVAVIANEAEVEKQVASLVATLTDIQSPEKKRVTPVAYQDIKTGLNKENISLKQRVEEGTVSISAKSESESLLQQDNSSSKTTQNAPGSVFMAKQHEKINVLEAREPELTTEKTLPKFATDIANMNRAVMAENKAEIPPMTKHFAHPEWNKEVGERVIWMHKQAVPSAELRLNPGHLGPITIKVDVNQDQVNVAFTAQHAAVKEAIDATLPKLREMFSAQQLNLGEVNVSQEDAGQKQHKGFSQMGGDPGKGEKKANETAENAQTEKTMDIADEIEAGRAIASNGVLSIFA